MAFKMIYQDICQMNVDAIVNSLGVDSKTLGSICKNIAFRAKSKEIDKVLYSHSDGKVFDMYVTDGGLLPAKHVIHIVTPFKKFDDELKSLDKAYKMVINEAIKRGYKSLAIPFIGTGANGYKNSEVFSIISKIGYDYVESDEIKIYVVIYNKKLEYEEYKYGQETTYYNSRIRDGSPKYIEKTYATKYIPDFMDATVEMNKIFNMVKKSEMYAPIGVVKNAVDFIYAYDEENHIGRKNDVNMWAIKKSTIHKYRSGLLEIPKEAIYKLAIVYGLNRTMFLQTMSLGGYSFNPSLKIDVWMYKYYYYNDICKDFENFQEKYHDDEIMKLLFYN